MRFSPKAKRTRLLVALLSVGGIALVTTGTCNPSQGTLSIYRNTDHGTGSVWDVFVDDTYYADDYYYDGYYYDEVYYDDCGYGCYYEEVVYWD